LSEVSAADSDADTLTIVQSADIFSLDPNKPLATHNFNMFMVLTDNLVRFGKTQAYELDPRLGIAERWEQRNPTRVRFFLRRGVKFVTGKEFTAADAKYSIERYVRDGVWQPAVSMIDHVETVDKHTIDIVTKRPSALLLDGLTATSYMLPEGWGESPDYSPDKMVGTGPYRVVAWEKGRQVVAEAFNDYWAGSPPFRRVIWRPIPDAFTRVAALLNNEGQIVRQVLPQDVARVNASGRARVESVAGQRCINVIMRDDIAPTNDVRVRQAFNFAIDVPEIVRTIHGGFAKQLEGQFTGPGVRGWDPAVKAYPYDPERAKALLKEAGHQGGLAVKLDTPRGRYAQDVETANAIAGMLRKVGVACEVVVNESAEYQAKYSGQRACNPLFLYASGNAIPDIENALNDILVGAQVPGTRGVHNKELSDIRDRLSQTVDPNARKPLYREAVKWIHDQAIAIFLYQQGDLYGVSNAVEWKPRSNEFIFPTEIKKKSS
jgi:peptide/nickel transport system substrate-binding protein